MKRAKKIRLNESEVKAIKDAVRGFDKDAKVYLFGSRAEHDKRGGDIDSLIMDEKKGLIDSADTLIEIRMVRNDIAHEYLPEAIKDIFKKVLRLTPFLIDSVEKVNNYCKKFGE